MADASGNAEMPARTRCRKNAQKAPKRLGNLTAENTRNAEKIRGILTTDFPDGTDEDVISGTGPFTNPCRESLKSQNWFSAEIIISEPAEQLCFLRVELTVGQNPLRFQ